MSKPFTHRSTARAERRTQLRLLVKGRRRSEGFDPRTLKLEQARKNQKAALNQVIRSRTVPPAVVSHSRPKIKSLAPHVEEVIQAEELLRNGPTHRDGSQGGQYH
jgi:hypothetical protein